MERIVGEEKATFINVEDMDVQKTDDLDEVYIFNKIRKETGISPVHFVYVPKKMKLMRYEVNSELGSAELLYDYKGQTFQYSMYMNDADSSHGYIESDELVNEYSITAKNEINVIIQEYSVVNQDNHRFAAEFEYQSAQYQLVGLMEKEEFDKIIKNLSFYDYKA